jgi:pyrroloquinoline-quinone synthase
VNNEEAFEETQALVDTFLSTAKRSYAAGLSALYVYEQQIPEVARSKEAGLRKFYGVTDDSTVDYFTLHATVDVEHSEATRRLVDALPEDLAAEALSGAEAASKALWSFLDKMHSVHQLSH